MAEPISVLRVHDSKLLRQFVDLPWKLYEGDLKWVAPLRREAMRTFSARQNPFFRHAEIELFLALNSRGVPLGRIAACVYPAYNQRFGRKSGFFGFLESVNDPRVAQALLRQVELWSKSRGMNMIVGPYNYAPTQDMGLLVDGFGTPPALLQLYNPPFYEDVVLQAGYQKMWSVGTYSVELSALKEQRSALIAESGRICAKHNLLVRELDRSRIESERELLLSIFNDSFSNNREVVPVSEDVFRFQTSSLLHIVDPRIIIFIEHRGEAVGVGLALPNFNEALSRYGGKVTLGMLLRWKNTMRSIESVVVVLLCARTTVHGLGLSRVIGAELLSRGSRAGYKRVYTGWVDEQNGVMKGALRRFGLSRPDKQYAIYKKEV